LCRFLLQCLEDLDNSLRKLNSRLFVVRGQPADVLPTLFKVPFNSQSVYLLGYIVMKQMNYQ
jgi:deoxyribodipyrimidine photolyase